MNEWAKVVTNPFGLAGFALLLVFWLVGKQYPNSAARWVSLVLAAVALVGGVVAGVQSPPASAVAQSQSSPKPAPQSAAPPPAIHQSTAGNNSPAMIGNGNSVTIGK
jgi:hypothetical protein